MATTPRQHGDRVGNPKPIEELVPEFETFDEASDVPPEAWRMLHEEGQRSVEWPIPQAEPTLDPDAPIRLQAVAIAAASYGQQGCYDDEHLLRRAEVIKEYIKRGLP